MSLSGAGLAVAKDATVVASKELACDGMSCGGVQGGSGCCGYGVKCVGGCGGWSYCGRSVRDLKRRANADRHVYGFRGHCVCVCG